MVKCVSLVQPEVMAAAQLERSKDVAAQSAAIAQLVALRPTSYGVVNALRACMHDAATYCRCETPMTDPAHPCSVIFQSPRF